ncbi:MAG: CpsD/CapB family tyrosine-protein kinase [Deltaproteobacteria bacterium]|nr:CpsD/CapB family tyrosine-protein kinase [Deltaproteobacteria bacterium]
MADGRRGAPPRDQASAAPSPSADVAERFTLPEFSTVPQAAIRHALVGEESAAQSAATVQVPAQADLSPPPRPGAVVHPGMASPPSTKILVSRHVLGSDLDPRLILVREPDSARSASFRVLRHRLVEKGNPRAVVVTSAERGEGKTTCAINLAIALSECGRARVLLLEANLRAPQLASLLGFIPPECFARQLARHREQPMDPWYVVQTASPWMHVAAMHPSGDSRPLLDAPAFSIAIDRLRLAGYDYLVIDTPPVLGSADVNLIQDAADGVLLTTRAGKSTARALRGAVEQLSPGKILGTVLID